MKYRDRFDRALATEDPRGALRMFALELATTGLRRNQVYNIFLDYHKECQASGRECAEAALGDVMDMICNTYKPYDLNIPE